MPLHETDRRTFARKLEALRQAGLKPGGSRHAEMRDTAAWLKRRGCAEGDPDVLELRRVAAGTGKPAHEIDRAIRGAWEKDHLIPVDDDAGRKRRRKPAADAAGRPAKPNPFAAPPVEVPAPEPAAETAAGDVAPDRQDGAPKTQADFWAAYSSSGGADCGAADGASQRAPKPGAMTLSEARLKAKMPKKLMSLGGHGGALLVEGDVMILAGAGGSGKSSLSAGLAVEAAAVPDLAAADAMFGRGGADADGGGPEPNSKQPPEPRFPILGGMFDWRGGPGCRVMIVQFEDHPAITARTLTQNAAACDDAEDPNADAYEGAGGVRREVLKHADEGVLILDLSDDEPLFGPLSDADEAANRKAGAGPDAPADDGGGQAEQDGGGARAFYNARPGKLAGWRRMEEAIDECLPKLVIVDPAVCAYVGEGSAAPVSEFLTALRKLARRPGCELGVLLVAHSTKEARRGGGASDEEQMMNPGQVSGSGAWFDRSRGVLVMTRIKPEDPAAEAVPVLVAQKSNYGPARLFQPVRIVRDETAGEERGRMLRIVGEGGKAWRPVSEAADVGPATPSAKDRERRDRAVKKDFAAGRDPRWVSERYDGVSEDQAGAIFEEWQREQNGVPEA